MPRQRAVARGGLDAMLHDAAIGGEAGEETRQVSVKRWAEVTPAIVGQRGAAGESCVEVD